MDFLRLECGAQGHWRARCDPGGQLSREAIAEQMADLPRELAFAERRIVRLEALLCANIPRVASHIEQRL
jgi:hypothetical protein